jgi:hypothetical protein
MHDLDLSMTDTAADRAVAELSRRVRLVAPASLLADPDAWAAAALAALRDLGYRHVARSPDPLARPGPAAPPNDAWHQARAALTERTTA